ncbi:MAG: DUF2786 domain-containing protein [Lachnospiraceae bacterium]|nr:DUF2786 domain-containing protein [Lachnospiraceae bacterium]
MKKRRHVEKLSENEKIITKIQNLLNLASNNPSEEEARAALLKAQELMLKYHVENPEPPEGEKVVQLFSSLGLRQKTEFVLLISAVIAANFRAKTVHYGQRVYFIGFEEDANAAKNAFEYTLHFGDAAHDKYFFGRSLTPEDDKNWRYGFIVGLKEAFDSREGYELMIKVPQKVQDFYDSLNLIKTGVKRSETVTRLEGAFTDGFRRGRESQSSRQIDDQQ